MATTYTKAGDALFDNPETQQATCNTCGLLVKGLIEAVKHLDAHKEA